MKGRHDEDRLPLAKDERAEAREETLAAWARATAQTLTWPEWQIRLDHAADDMDAGFGEAKERALLAELDRIAGEQHAFAAAFVGSRGERVHALSKLQIRQRFRDARGEYTPLGRAVLRRLQEQAR